MPFKSQKQAKFFFAAANKPGGLNGLSQKSAQSFINDTGSQKIGQLPNYTSKPKKPKFPMLGQYMSSGNK